jgi:hypothetical protein
MEVCGGRGREWVCDGLPRVLMSLLSLTKMEMDGWMYGWMKQEVMRGLVPEVVSRHVPLPIQVDD